MSVLMTPDLANFSDNVHGGAILKLLDQVAYACASGYAQSYVVTLWVDRVLFRDLIHVGELVTFSAAVNYTGKTSMEIGIRVDTANVMNGATRHTNSSYFTMVAVDSDGNPVPVPPFASPRCHRTTAFRVRPSTSARTAPTVRQPARMRSRERPIN